MHNDVCYSNEYGSVWMTVSWTAGATGAVGALNPSTRAKGFAKTFAVRNGVGDYTVTMADKSYDLLAFIINCNGPVSAVAGKIAQVTADTSTTVRFTFVSAAGAAADPANGDQIYVNLLMKRRSPL